MVTLHSLQRLSDDAAKNRDEMRCQIAAHPDAKLHRFSSFSKAGVVRAKVVALSNKPKPNV